MIAEMQQLRRSPIRQPWKGDLATTRAIVLWTRSNGHKIQQMIGCLRKVAAAMSIESSHRINHACCMAVEIEDELDAEESLL
jgi:hypothetical protein